MICKLCAEAADTQNLELHKDCAASKHSAHCTCQHRVAIVKCGVTRKNEGNNGDGS